MNERSIVPLETGGKRISALRGLRVFPQSRRISAPSAGPQTRLAGGLWRHPGSQFLRSAWLPLVCGAFLVATFALVVAAGDAAFGVETDAQSRVVAVIPGSPAASYGIQPGWRRTTVTVNAWTEGVAFEDPATNFTESFPSIAPDPISELWPGFLALGAACGALLLRLRRLGAALAVLATIPAIGAIPLSWRSLEVILIFVPAALGLALAYRSLGDLPRRPSTAARIAALAVSAAVVFAAGAALTERRQAIVAVTLAEVALAALAYVWWRTGIALARVAELNGGERPGLAVAREVAFDLLPLAEWGRRSVAQAERNRLANDLHAEVLPAIASKAAELEQRGDAETAEQLRELAADVREIMSARRLPVLEEEGLVAAAEWFAERIEDRTALRIEIDLAGDSGERAPRGVERAAYRVLQLALDNVIRHAGASLATVRLAASPRSLALSVEDDGTGIDADAPARAMRNAHLGLVDMRSEAEAVGAALSVARGPERGTVVTFRWRA